MTARYGNNAKGTSIATSVLDFETGPGLSGLSPPAGLRNGQLGMSEHVIGVKSRHGDKRCRNIGRNVTHQGFMAVADHRLHSRQGSNLLRRALCIATGHHNASLGVLTVHSAEKGAGSAIRLGGDAAGVGNDDVCLGGARGGGQATLA